MRIEEAYKILEVKEDISDTDLDKTFKKLAVKYHPDRNKEEGSERKAKEISEAYNTIKSFRENPPPAQQGSPFGGVGFDINDIFNGNFNPFQQRKIEKSPDIHKNLKISFADSILGCVRKVDVIRDGACDICEGHGEIPSEIVCGSCDGNGQTVSRYQRGNTIHQNIINCDKCKGSGFILKDCEACKGVKFYKNQKKSFDVTIPAGIVNGNKLRLQKSGNYNEKSGHVSDIYISVYVEAEYELTRLGNNIISKCNISLEDAISGVEKEVKTVRGTKKIKIPPLENSKYVHTLEKHGLAGRGDHNIEIIVNWDRKILEEKLNKKGKDVT